MASDIKKKQTEKTDDATNKETLTKE